MKRGQILGVPLVLLFALIVGALILAYGAKVAIDLVNEADYIDFLDSMSDLENNIQTFSHYDEGSSKVYDIDLPTDVEAVCFYNDGKDFDCTLDGEICDEILEGTLDLLVESNFNVYVYPNNAFDQTRLNIEDFETEAGNPECISNGHSLLITAYSDYVGLTYYE